MSLFWSADIRPDAQPHKILIARDVLVDKTRNARAVPFKVYYPVDHDCDSLPLIIWSHGLGGSREGSGFLARYIASHGYLVVHLQHEGTGSDLWEGKEGHPWDVIRNTKIPRSAFIDRFKDVPFFIDKFPEWIKSQENPYLSKYLDLSNIAIAGHSLGALTAQVMAGQKAYDGDGALLDLADKRIKASGAYSMIPADFMSSVNDPKAYETMSIPLLCMTGTDDESPIETCGYKERLPVFDKASSKEKYLVVLDDGDHMVFSGSRGQLKENPRRAEHEAIIKIVSLAFWEVHLRDNIAARAWLQDDGAADFLSSESDYRLSKL